MDKGNLVVFDLQEINKEIIEAAIAIDPEVQFAYRYDENYFVLNLKKDQPYHFYDYHILEATPKDNRPRSRFFNRPIGKKPEPPRELVYLEVKPDQNFHYKVIICCYGAIGRGFADKLSDDLIFRDIDVVLIVKPYEKTAKVKR